jgi:hypothetical protein
MPFDKPGSFAGKLSISSAPVGVGVAADLGLGFVALAYDRKLVDVSPR